MEHAPVHIVDMSIVAREDCERFVALIRDEIAPVMTDAGAEFLSLLSTSPEIGEDVQVQVTWKVADHSVWNVVRKNYFMDPRYHARSAKMTGMRKGGQRRFYYPAG